MRLGAKIAGRFDAREKWEAFLDALGEFFGWRLLAVALAVTVVAVASKVLTMDLALRGVGQSLPYATLVLAYVLPTMLGRLSGLPAGGIGVTEAGMIGFLTTAGDLDTGTATAAVAVYRIATVFFQALLGALVYAFAWRGENETAVEGV